MFKEEVRLNHENKTINVTKFTGGGMSLLTNDGPVPVATGSGAWVCDHPLAGLLGSNPAGAWMSVSCECCVSSGRGLCDGLITRPEESECGVSECDREASIMRRPWSTGGLLCHGRGAGES